MDVYGISIAHFSLLFRQQDMVTYYAALVETLEARYANALAIAAEYKALMEAALDS
jgi:hypothetical protein